MDGRRKQVIQTTGRSMFQAEGKSLVLGVFEEEQTDHLPTAKGEWVE